MLVLVLRLLSCLSKASRNMLRPIREDMFHFEPIRSKTKTSRDHVGSRVFFSRAWHCLCFQLPPCVSVVQGIVRECPQLYSWNYKTHTITSTQSTWVISPGLSASPSIAFNTFLSPLTASKSSGRQSKERPSILKSDSRSGSTHGSVRRVQS